MSDRRTAGRAASHPRSGGGPPSAGLAGAIIRSPAPWLRAAARWPGFWGWTFSNSVVISGGNGDVVIGASDLPDAVFRQGTYRRQVAGSLSALLAGDKAGGVAMILVLGMLGDSGIGLLVHRLLDRNLPFLILDPREHGSGFQLTWEMDGEHVVGSLRHGRQVTPLDEVKAVYVHLLRTPVRTGGEARKAADTSAMLHAFFETTSIPVCNRPSCSATNFSKTYQQQIIAAHGFAVPRTLVTNRPDEAALSLRSAAGA